MRTGSDAIHREETAEFGIGLFPGWFSLRLIMVAPYLEVVVNRYLQPTAARKDIWFSQVSCIIFVTGFGIMGASETLHLLVFGLVVSALTAPSWPLCAVQ